MKRAPKSTSAAPAASAHTSLRLSPDTMRRVDALVAKLRTFGAKRATVLKLAVERGLDALEREHK